MDSSSDSDDCQLYTRTAQHIAIKKKQLDEDRVELALRMKYLPDDQVPGYSHVFERMNESLERSLVGPEVLISSEDEIPLSLRSLRPRRGKRKGAKLPKKAKKTKGGGASKNKSSTSSSCTATNNANEIPTIVFDDDTGYPSTSFAPIQFNRSSKDNREDEDDSLPSLDALKRNYDDVEYEDLETPVKIIVDWKKDNKQIGFETKHFELRRYQKFETVFEELSRTEGIPMNRVVLMRHFDTIRPRDTPASLKLTYYGHLIGVVSEVDVDHSLPKPSDFDDDFQKPPEEEITVKLLLDSKTSLSLTILKKQKMNVLYKKCAEELKVPDNKIKISFDGDIVEQEDTVTGSGIEDGDVFEVTIKKE